MLHYTGMRTAAEAVARLRDPVARVSSHYVVDEDGGILRLVPEDRRAWHAGISFWRGRTGLNDGSVGIEIVNPGHDWGYRDFPPAQMESVRALCLGILSRYAIPAGNVVAHSDIAPDRKQDPGEKFPWAWLAESGVGLWPPEHPPPPAPEACDASAPDEACRLLSAIGYDGARCAADDALFAATLRAACRHWRPACIESALSPALMARLRAVAAASA